MMNKNMKKSRILTAMTRVLSDVGEAIYYSNEYLRMR